MRVWITALAALVLVSCGDEETRAQRDARLCKDKTNAYYEARAHVENQLRSPSTAEFPYVLGGDVHIVSRREDCSFTIRSYVDAQNAFGATIRQKWIADVRYAGKDRYKVVSFTFQ